VPRLDRAKNLEGIRNTQGRIIELSGHDNIAATVCSAHNIAATCYIPMPASPSAAPHPNYCLLM